MLDVLFRGIPLQADQLQQAHLRNDEPLPSARDHETWNDGQRERNLELDRGAFARPAENVDHAPDLLDVGLHHIHADPASRDVGNGLRRGESGVEDQVQRLAIAQLLRLFGPQQPFLDGLLLDPCDVNPGSVIADFDVDLSAFVIGAKGQFARRWFARSHPGVGRFDAVVAGVPNQVDQRILDGLDDGPVELRLGSVHVQPDLFAERDCHVAHHAWQFVPDRPDGLHAGLHDALLQLGGDQVEPLRGRVEGGILALGVELEDLIPRQHQFPHQVHEFVQQPDPDPDIRVRHGRRLPGVLFGLLALGELAAVVLGFRRRRGQRVRSGLAWIGLASPRATQTFGQVLKAVRTFFSARFDGGQYFSRRIDGFEDQGHQGGCEVPLSIA